MHVSWVKVGCSGVRVQSIACLVVARLIQSSEIVPDFGDVRIQSDSSRVRIKGISVLVDLIVKDTNRAPEGRVTTITIDSLLVSFVCLGVFLLRHVTSA